MKIHRSQNGETIIEVLIAVAVLSLILTATLALANRSSQANRQAAERSQALKIAQSEMEKLKYYLSTGATPPNEGQYFCMNEDSTDVVDLGINPDELVTNPNFDRSLENAQAYSRYSGSVCDVGDQYKRFILRGNNNPANSPANIDANTYIVFVRWVAVTGNGIDQATMTHSAFSEIIFEHEKPHHLMYRLAFSNLWI